MNTQLENAWLSLDLNPETASFSLSHRELEHIRIDRAGFGVKLAQSSTVRDRNPETLLLQSSGEELGAATANGPLDRVHLIYGPVNRQFALHVHIGLLREGPLMLLRMRLENLADFDIFPDEFIFLQTSPAGLSFQPGKNSRPFFLSNGWQSWSPTRIYHSEDRQQRTRLGLLARPMIQNHGQQPPSKRGTFTSDMFALLGDQDAGSALMAGFLSQKQQFGSLLADLNGPFQLTVRADADRITLRPGASLETDWAAFGFVSTNSPSPMEPYLAAVQRENAARLPTKPPLGWCSWYHYFTRIDERVIRANLRAIKQGLDRLPLELVQIDDGFEKNVGEWLEFNERFPNGVKPLADEIKREGLTPGLWLAPYIVQRGSGLLTQHPDWLLRDRRGKLVNAGFGWNTLTSGLDLTVPEAMEYTREVIRTAAGDWGFPYLKLDFLYAAALPGIRHDPTRTGAQILREGLEVIREAAGPDTTLLGCGCPLGSGIGVMDLMRISADVAPQWAPSFNGIQFLFAKEPNMPCARNAIQNILNRCDLDQRWWGNDPDCLLTRPDTDLSLEEVQSLASVIGMTGGALLISDDMTKLPEERLRIAQSLIPHIRSNPRVLDRFEGPMPARLLQFVESAAGAYPLAVFFNWEDTEADLDFVPEEWGLGAGREWLGREYWTGEIAYFTDAWRFPKVPAHGCRLISLRPVSEVPTYVGSDLHFSQGLEVTKWQLEGNTLELTLNLGRLAEGNCYLECPQLPKAVFCAGQAVPWENVDGGLVRIPVRVSGETSLTVKF